MSREELRKLADDVLGFQDACIEKARNLSNEQLDTKFTITLPSGAREFLVRDMLYRLVDHPREHSVHIGKILQKTDSPLARPSEAQAVLAKAKEAWGEMEAVLACLDDEDLGRELEGHSLRSVLVHLRNAHRWYLEAIEKGIQASGR